MLNINEIYHGNCLDVLKTFPDKSIDCCITSPPYWGLRDYEHEEQLGNEQHFNEYIDKLCNIFDEVKRVLKDEGTLFVNLGDTYGGSGAGTTKYADTSKYLDNSKQSYILPNGIAKSSQFKNSNLNKSLLLIPERFAIEMLNRKWTLRNEIIWHKPNQTPQSAKDRFTVDFEKIFFFVKQSKSYYFEQQFEPYTKPLNRWGGDKLKANNTSNWDEGTGQNTYRERNMRPNPNGRNMRAVWSINTKPTKYAHFATYPEKLVERMIKAGCPKNGIVLDPFFGSGTTGVCARKLDRNFIGIELNEKYIEIANKRLKNY